MSSPPQGWPRASTPSQELVAVAPESTVALDDCPDVPLLPRGGLRSAETSERGSRSPGLPTRSHNAPCGGETPHGSSLTDVQLAPHWQPSVGELAGLARSHPLTRYAPRAA